MLQSGSTPIRRKLALAAVPLALALSAIAAGGVAGSAPQSFSFEKDCTGANPYCVIQDASAPFEFLDGMSVWYDGPATLGIWSATWPTSARRSRSARPPTRSLPPATSASSEPAGHGRSGRATARSTITAAGVMTFVGCAGDTCTYALTGTYHVNP